MEGYPNAAAKFSKEANLQPQQDSASIRARQEIQASIHSGDIQAAIETLNELDPQVWFFPFSAPACGLDIAHYTSHVFMIKTRVIHAPRKAPVYCRVLRNTTYL